MLAFLNRENTVAPPGYNRWLVPPAALSVHLAIGQAAAALACGASVIVKPAEQTPLVAHAVVRLLREAGIPEAERAVQAARKAFLRWSRRWSRK